MTDMMVRAADTVEIVDSEFEYLYTVATNVIDHIPSQVAHNRSVLCRHFNTASGCLDNTSCRFFHVRPAVLEQCKRSAIHVNYAWRGLDCIKYPRNEPGKTLMVWAPNHRDPCLEVASERILVTKGSQMALDPVKKKKGQGVVDSPVCHCAHYYFNRLCYLGSNCMFIHEICVDPEARNLQKAPVRHVIRYTKDTRAAVNAPTNPPVVFIAPPQGSQQPYGNVPFFTPPYVYMNHGVNGGAGVMPIPQDLAAMQPLMGQAAVHLPMLLSAQNVPMFMWSNVVVN